MHTYHSSVCNFFAFIKWLLSVVRLTEVTMTGNSLCSAGKILVLVKLMALTIYAKVGLLRPLDLAVARPRPQILAPRPRSSITDSVQLQLVIIVSYTGIFNKMQCWSVTPACAYIETVGYFNCLLTLQDLHLS